MRKYPHTTSTTTTTTVNSTNNEKKLVKQNFIPEVEEEGQLKNTKMMRSL